MKLIAFLPIVLLTRMSANIKYLQNLEKNVTEIHEMKEKTQSSPIKGELQPVPHPDIFWAYSFLEVKDWIV